MAIKSTKALLSAEDRLHKLEESTGRLQQRCLQLERVVRIIGREFEKTHLSESDARKWAHRANSLGNAMREVRGHLKKYGNEFDRAPHFTDPENDWQE